MNVKFIQTKKTFLHPKRCLLDFKNIPGLIGLNFDSSNNEVHAHINKMNLEALANMVETHWRLHGEFTHFLARCLQTIYIMNLLDTLESRRDIDFGSG